jgi:hypothetical protein
MKTCGAWREKRGLVPGGEEEVSGGQLNRGLGVQNVSATRSAAVPVIQFREVYTQTSEHRDDTVVVFLCGPVKCAARIIVHQHLSTRFKSLALWVVTQTEDAFNQRMEAFFLTRRRMPSQEHHPSDTGREMIF